MAQSDSRSDLPAASTQALEFVANVGDVLHVPEPVRELLAARGVQRVRVALTPDDRPDELVARGIDSGAVDAIAATTGLERAIVVRGLGAEGTAADGFAARLRELGGGGR